MHTFLFVWLRFCSVFFFFFTLLLDVETPHSFIDTECTRNERRKRKEGGGRKEKKTTTTTTSVHVLKNLYS